MKFHVSSKVVTVSADLLKQMVASQWFIVLIVSWIFYMPWKTPMLRRKARFVYPKPGKEANVLLIEGIKQGKNGFRVLPPLFTYNERTNEAEMKAMLYGE